ncbi:MAG TPA: lmo0937 family membrane protein [Terriglobales bacterium]|nr:lmo0937 family membrane protein [Terriglobales bacterium]
MFDYVEIPPAIFGKGGTMLWTIVVILFVLWLLGFGFHVGGGLIHLLLVVALVIVIINLLRGRGTAL